jgi:hypothetical protein
MSTDDRIPLREAARRLTGYGRFRHSRTRGKQELLKLLQKGEVTATFDFPSAARPSIAIPAKFWLDFPSGDFNKQLISSASHGKHGQFLVRPGKFVDRYVEWFKFHYFDLTGKPPTDISAELAAALTGVKEQRESYILESEWARFVRDAGFAQIEHHEAVQKSPKGLKALESWEVVLVEVAAECLCDSRRAIAWKSNRQ